MGQSRLDGSEKSAILPRLKESGATADDLSRRTSQAMSRITISILKAKGKGAQSVREIGVAMRRVR